jgi:hypothetical protein
VLPRSVGESVCHDSAEPFFLYPPTELADGFGPEVALRPPCRADRKHGRTRADDSPLTDLGPRFAPPAREQHSQPAVRFGGDIPAEADLTSKELRCPRKVTEWQRSMQAPA